MKIIPYLYAINFYYETKFKILLSSNVQIQINKAFFFF